MRKWLSEGLLGFAFITGFFVWMAICIALSWLVMQGLAYLTTHFFIPYPPTSYLYLSGGANPLPTTILGFFSVPFANVPNSFFAFFWAFTLLVQIINLKNDWADLPAKHRKGQTRHMLIKQLWTKKFKHFVIYTGIFLLFCVPGLRSYQIVTNQQIRYVDYFSSQEKTLFLSELTSVNRYQYGQAKRLIGWSLSFKNNTVLDVTAPTKGALIQLLALPNMDSNIEIRGGQLFLKQQAK